MEIPAGNGQRQRQFKLRTYVRDMAPGTQGNEVGSGHRRPVDVARVGCERECDGSRGREQMNSWST